MKNTPKMLLTSAVSGVVVYVLMLAQGSEQQQAVFGGVLGAVVIFMVIFTLKMRP